MTFPVEPAAGADVEAPASMDEIRARSRGATESAERSASPPPPLDPDPPADAAPPAAGTGEPFRVGEKIASLVDLALNAEPRTSDPAVTMAMRAVRMARRMGLLRMVSGVFPPLDNDDAWHEWLGIAVGVCLELTSDGVELDVDACRAAGAETLRSAFGE